jgi:hypothetical protein
LYEGLIEALGQQRATTLMEHLPPVGWADVATRTDLDHQAAAIKAGFDQQFAALRTQIERLDAKIDGRAEQLDAKIDRSIEQLDAKFDRSIEQLDAKIDSSTALLRTEIEARFNGFEMRMERTMRENLRTMVFALLASNATFGGVVLAAVKLV